MKKKAETTRLKSTSDSHRHGPFSSIRQVHKDYKLGREVRRRERQDQGRNRSEAQEQEVNQDQVSLSSASCPVDKKEKVIFGKEVVQDHERDQEHQHEQQYQHQENEQPKSGHSGDDGDQQDDGVNASATNTQVTTSRPAITVVRTNTTTESTTATSTSDNSSFLSSHPSGLTLNRRKNPWCTDGNYGETQRYIQARYRETRSWYSESRFSSSVPFPVATKSPSSAFQPPPPIRPTATTPSPPEPFISPRSSWRKER